MTESLDTAPSADGAGPAPVAAQGPAVGVTAQASDRPEVPVAAAFAGGFLAALLLRRLAR